MMDSDAKSALKNTIRDLRGDLLTDLHDAVDSRYRMSLRKRDAELPAGRERDRIRLEERIDERVRARREEKKEEESKEEARERLRREIEKEAAYTLLNRLVVLRLMEEAGLSAPAVVDGGWDSDGYREFREWAPALCDDETEGYRPLLELVFDERARDLPGLFGEAGAAELVPVPADTLRTVVEALNDEALDPVWSDDTTLGWVYQYWNDPEREQLDEKIKNRGNIEPNEVASKTQLFTERYMVEWLLQNSLGSKWLAICAKNGWTPEVAQGDDIWRDGPPDEPIEEPQSLLADLEKRRRAWREKRENGEVELDELMPINGEREEHWKYWVPRQMPEDDPGHAPDSIRDLELLDPACGSGHFLVIAFDLLFDFYQEEARHRGEDWSEREISESILENNLHGVDIDARAVQIAAAALYLKAKTTCEDAQPTRLNLVAPQLQFANLPDDDPALNDFREAVSTETDLSGDLVDTILDALGEAFHLGTLLKIDEAVEDAIKDSFGWGQDTPLSASRQIGDEVERAKATILSELDDFLVRHTAADDLGLRLHGEQLANGVRFLQVNRENRYDVVAANPPYLAGSKMADTSYIEDNYEEGKRDLYAAFLMRGPQLSADGGSSALITQRNWMFIKTFEDLRKELIQNFDIRVFGDIGTYAFEQMTDHVAANISIIRASETTHVSSIATNLTEEEVVECNHTAKRRSSLLAQIGRHEFDVEKLEGIEGRPLIYWWANNFVERFVSAPKLGAAETIKAGVKTTNNRRFIQRTWEARPGNSMLFEGSRHPDWPLFIKGARGKEWFEPGEFTIRWRNNGLQLRTYKSVSENVRPREPKRYFTSSISFSQIGSYFRARINRLPSIVGDKGSAVYPQTSSLPNLVCLMNSSHAKKILQSLNPGVDFKISDVERLPVFQIDCADAIVARIQNAFAAHEAHREASLEFRQPGLSCWEYAQDWAQHAVDREDGEPLPNWKPEYEQPESTAWVSYAVGVAFGRFGLNGEGILSWASGKPVPCGPHVLERDKADKQKGGKQNCLQLVSSDPPTFHRLEGDPVFAEPVKQEVLPDGILYVSATDGADSLEHEACDYLHEMWDENGSDVGRKKDDLNSYLREKYFKDWVKDEYEKRPIYFPLTSADKNFVAHVSIHRWDIDTLRKLLADHLKPEFKRLQGRLDDMQSARASDEGSDDIEDRIVQCRDWVDELEDFIELVRQCAEEGPPKYDEDEPDRERDHRYDPVLDDGVMINAAALWPLLEPVWKKPRDWWNRLATEKGYRRKHFDWSMLAAKYWPTRVYEKCQEDPSLAVAHGCFWKYHPDKAYEWELRLKFDMDDPSFVIDEEFPEFILDGDADEPTTSAEARERFFEDQPERVEEIRADERSRREREAGKDNHRPDEVIPVPEPGDHVPEAELEAEEWGDVVDFDGTDADGDRADIAANVRRFREEQELSVEELADQAGIAESAVRSIEHGERDPSPDELYDLAAALGVSTNALESGEREPDDDYDSDSEPKEAARSGFEDE